MGYLSTLKGEFKRRAKIALRYADARARSATVPLSPENWGLSCDALRGLTWDGIALHEMPGRWGSPLHVVNARRLRENAARFLKATRDGTPCEVFYSYKTNPVPGVLALLHAAGVGAEVISPYELWLAQQLGVPNERIIYNGPAKSSESIRRAIEDDIQLLCVNHREELAVIIDAAKAAGKRPRVAIRISPPGGWAAQFGIPVDGGAALAAYREALDSGQLQVVGLHAHRGGLIRGEAALIDFTDAVLAFSDTLRRELRLELDVIDFGGSLCPPTVAALGARERRLNQTFQRDLPAPNTSQALTIERYISRLTMRVEAHYRQIGLRRPRIFLEPGRAMSSDAQLLLASVITTKRADDTTYAILDAGINLAESVRSEYHQLLPVNRYFEKASRLYTIVGPICSPGDTLYSAVRLPELRPSDTLAIMDAGAYFVPFATSFSFPQPAIVCIDDGRERLLRRAERFTDRIAYDGSSLEQGALKEIHQASGILARRDDGVVPMVRAGHDP